MIESLLNPGIVLKKPYKSMIAGIIFSLVSGMITLYIQEPGPGSGFLFVAFISIAAAPFFVHVLRIEEEEEKEKAGNFFTRHLDIVTVYAWLFLGIVIGSSLMYVLTPDAVAEKMFHEQLKDLKYRGAISASAVRGASFTSIFVNNSYVLIIAFVTSFMLGAGAIFLVSWNASVLGVLAGKIAENPGAFGLPSLGSMIGNYLLSLPFLLITILPHGILEFTAYFLGAVAGGILSAAIVRESVKGVLKYKQIVIDALAYLGLSFALLFLGAIVETIA